jgi:predicted Zn finger-like uncharacterized protein
MYTQCPDCDTAFRVTAPDLQRAAGRVVCIGCTREFNALERLTEGPPAASERAHDKRSILETLDELTGPHEIRIEDTGVEWRVIEEDEAADDDLLQAGVSEAEVDESSSVRWYIADVADQLDNAPDVAFDDAVADNPRPEPGGELTSQTPRADESRELSLEDPGASSPQESLQLPPAGRVRDVQRYDDNTPLPDEYLIDEGEPRVLQRRAEDRIEPRSPEADEAQVDLGFGEPDDWMELLDEVGPPSRDSAIEGPSPGSTGEPVSARGVASGNGDALADTDVRPVLEEDEPAVDDGYPSDIDTQFDLQAIELGINLTGSRNLSLVDETEDPGEDMRLEAGEPAAEDLENDLALEVGELELATDGAPPYEETRRPAAPQSVTASGPAARSVAPTVAADECVNPAGDTAHRASEDSEAAEERHREEAFEQELAAAYPITLDDALTDSPDEPAKAGHFVPPATEEEMTINMMIDQDLIRLAEQQNVFTSTRAHLRPDDAPHVETIIMEGEFVRHVLEAELLAEKPQDSGASHDGRQRPSVKTSATGAAGSKVAASDDDDILLDTYIKSKDRLRGGRRRTDPPSYGVIAGVAGLSLVLAAQVVHAYRDTLATYAMFDRTVGSVYRLLGEPLIPGWNVREWKFETTSGSTDEMDEVLTISSRIANSSRKPLPFPLLHVSLTDRWEEIIGSKVLEPAEYLAGSADPAVRVNPGESFTAVVRVEAPAPEATGFKLNVCYPETGDRVRCATEDFKD